MNAQPDVRKLIHQTQRYEFTDGLRDMQYAWLMAIIGITAWLYVDNAALWRSFIVELSTRFETVGTWLSYVLVVLPWVPILASIVVMRSLRKRWLWRESGYVQSKSSVVPRHVQCIAAIIATAVIGIGLWLQLAVPYRELFFIKMIFVASGWAFGYTLTEIGIRLELRRYIRVGLLGSIATAPLLVIPLTVGQAGLIWGAIWSLLLVLSGWQPLRQAILQVGEARHE